MDGMRLYDLTYALAARDGREGALFGASAPVAREAFARGLVGSRAFPELWFELPLAGGPWFDLHMLWRRADVAEGASFAGLSGAYEDALAWFSAAGNVRQLALSFDSGSGDAARPAAQLLVDGPGVATMEGFLTSCGRGDLSPACRAFVTGMPRSWYACYVGVFPQRAGEGMSVPWLRLECLVGGACQRAYAEDASALAADLARVGLPALDGTTVPRIRELARSPFPLELQFDVGPDGRAMPAVGASLRLPHAAWLDPDGSGAHAAFAQAEAWGLCDGRWRELAGTAFARRVRARDEEAHLTCYPAFIKLRWREGHAPDAKAYLVAGCTRRSGAARGDDGCASDHRDVRIDRKRRES